MHTPHLYILNISFEEYELFKKYKVKKDKGGGGTYDMNICIEIS